MYLVISKCVTAVEVSNFSGHYLRNRSTLDIGVLGYIGIVQHKEHSPEVLSIPPGTSCIISNYLFTILPAVHLYALQTTVAATIHKHRYSSPSAPYECVRGSQGIATGIPLPTTLDGASGQLHGSTSLPSGKEKPPAPTEKRDWMRSRAGLDALARLTRQTVRINVTMRHFSVKLLQWKSNKYYTF